MVSQTALRSRSQMQQVQARASAQRASAQLAQQQLAPQNLAQATPTPTKSTVTVGGKEIGIKEYNAAVEWVNQKSSGRSGTMNLKGISNVQYEYAIKQLMKNPTVRSAVNVGVGLRVASKYTATPLTETWTAGGEERTGIVLKDSKPVMKYERRDKPRTATPKTETWTVDGVEKTGIVLKDSKPVMTYEGGGKAYSIPEVIGVSKYFEQTWKRQGTMTSTEIPAEKVTVQRGRDYLEPSSKWEYTKAKFTPTQLKKQAVSSIMATSAGWKKNVSPIINPIADRWGYNLATAGIQYKGKNYQPQQLPMAFPTREGIAKFGAATEIKPFADASPEAKEKYMKSIAGKPSWKLSTVGESAQDTFGYLKEEGSLWGKTVTEKTGSKVLGTVTSAVPETIAWIGAFPVVAGGKIAAGGYVEENIIGLTDKKMGELGKEMSLYQKENPPEEGYEYAPIDETLNLRRGFISQDILKQSRRETALAGAFLIGAGAIQTVRMATKTIPAYGTSFKYRQQIKQFKVKESRITPPGKNIYAEGLFKSQRSVEVTTPFKKTFGFKPKTIYLGRASLSVKTPTSLTKPGEPYELIKQKIKISKTTKTISSQEFKGLLGTGKRSAGITYKITPFKSKVMPISKAVKGRLTSELLKTYPRIETVGKTKIKMYEWGVESQRLGGKFKPSYQIVKTKFKANIELPRTKFIPEFTATGIKSKTIKLPRIKSFEFVSVGKKVSVKYGDFYSANLSFTKNVGKFIEPKVAGKLGFRRGTVIERFVTKSPLEVTTYKIIEKVPAYKPSVTYSLFNPDTGIKVFRGGGKKSSAEFFKNLYADKGGYVGSQTTANLPRLILDKRAPIPAPVTLDFKPSTLVLPVIKPAIDTSLIGTGWMFTSAIRPKVITVPTSRVMVDTKIDVDTKVDVDTTLDIDTTLGRVSELQLQPVIQAPVSIQQPVQIQTPIQTPVVVPRITTPQILQPTPRITETIIKPPETISIFTKTKKVSISKTKGYSILGKRYGTWSQVGKADTLIKARIKGRAYLRKTLAASIRVRGPTGKLIPFKRATGEFRYGKEGPITLVQKKTRRLKAKSETVEIIKTRKGRKQKKLKWL